MKSLIGRYEQIEMLFAILLFIPFYIGFLKMTGEEVTMIKVGVTTVFLGIFLLIRNIVMQYFLIQWQNGSY